MLFGYHTVDKSLDEHLRDIAALASDPRTLVFIDTNVIAYLYKLHDAARQEFFAWSDGIAATHRAVSSFNSLGSIFGSSTAKQVMRVSILAIRSLME